MFMQALSGNIVSSFSVNDLAAAKSFYTKVLGLNVREDAMGILEVRHDNGGMTWVYPKPDHQPATFTVLNFPVSDLSASVDQLIARGITFEQYHSEYLQTDKKGIMHGDGKGPDIAWFKDPAGNIMSVVQENKS